MFFGLKKEKDIFIIKNLYEFGLFISSIKRNLLNVSSRVNEF
jgi:hypothetical protein